MKRNALKRDSDFKGEMSQNTQPTATAVAMLLHGGKANDRSSSKSWHLSRVRMRPFVRDLEQNLGDRAQVTLVRYRVRGWNGADRSPVHDAYAALQASIARNHGAPHVLIGHSMGGRVAATLAAEPDFTSHLAGVVALAPWWPDNEGTFISREVPVRVLHGTRDSWTSPSHSREQVQALASLGHDATWEGMGSAGHFMFRKPSAWTNFVTQNTLDLLHMRVPESGHK